MGCYVLVKIRINNKETKCINYHYINKDYRVFRHTTYYGSGYLLMHGVWNIYFTQTTLIFIERVPKNWCYYHFGSLAVFVEKEVKELIEKLANCDFYGVCQILKKYEN